MACVICMEPKVDVQHIHCAAQHTICYDCLDRYGRQQYFWNDADIPCKLVRATGQPQCFQCCACRLGHFDWMSFQASALPESFSDEFYTKQVKILRTAVEGKHNTNTEEDNYMLVPAALIKQGPWQPRLARRLAKRKRNQENSFSYSCRIRTHWKDEVEQQLIAYQNEHEDDNGELIAITLCRHPQCCVVGPIALVLSHQWKCSLRTYMCPYESHQCQVRMIVRTGMTLEREYQQHMEQNKCDSTFTCHLSECHDRRIDTNHRHRAMNVREYIEHRRNVRLLHMVIAETRNQLESLWMASRSHHSWSTARLSEWIALHMQMNQIHQSFARMHRLEYPSPHQHRTIHQLFLQWMDNHAEDSSEDE